MKEVEPSIIPRVGQRHIGTIRHSETFGLLFSSALYPNVQPLNL
jgi:hypothetical protein